MDRAQAMKNKGTVDGVKRLILYLCRERLSFSFSFILVDSVPVPLQNQSKKERKQKAITNERMKEKEERQARDAVNQRPLGKGKG